MASVEGQLQDETRNIYVWEFDALYIRGLTVSSERVANVGKAAVT